MVTYLSSISEYPALYMHGDSRLYWGVPSLCGCRDNSPFQRSTPYFFGGGKYISEFPDGTRVKKVAGFIKLSNNLDKVDRIDDLHVGKEFVVQSTTVKSFTCGDCLSRRPKRNVTTYTLVGSDGEELVLNESELDQNPHCRGWEEVKDTTVMKRSKRPNETQLLIHLLEMMEKK